MFEFSGKLIFGKGLFKIQMRLKKMYHYIIFALQIVYNILTKIELGNILIVKNVICRKEIRLLVLKRCTCSDSPGFLRFTGCLNGPLAPWRHFTTTRILQGFTFLCKLGALLFNPFFKNERKNVKDSGRSSKMTPSSKWPISERRTEMAGWVSECRSMGRGVRRQRLLLSLQW